MKKKEQDYDLLSFVFGLVSVFLFFSPLIGLGFGILALIFNKKHKKETKFKTAGLILGILGIIFNSIALIFFIVVRILSFTL